MNNEQLLCFLSAARHLNFTRAAEECHMVQTTASRQVAALEKEMGVQLFERRGRSLALTPAGKYLVGATRTYMSQYARLVVDCRLASANQDAPLLIRTGPWESFLLSEPLAEFVRRYGDSVQLSCNTNSYTILSNKLRRSELSLAFCTADCAQSAESTLSVTPVYKKPWLVAGAPHLDFWGLPAQDKGVLRDQQVILGNKGPYEEFEPYCVKNALKQQGFLRGTLLPTQLSMARAGCGVTLVPPWLPDYMLEGLRTEECLTVPYEPTIVMVVRTDRSSPQLTSLRQLCQDHFTALDAL